MKYYKKFGFIALVIILIIGALFISSPVFAKDSANLFSISGFKKDAPEVYNQLLKKNIQVDNVYFPCGDILVDRDGYKYHTVMLGSQCWMADNLKTKTGPDGISLTFGFDGSERDCITTDNQRGTEKDCQVRGALYSYAAITKDNGGPGLCPRGWHIPTDADFATLEQGLTDPGYSCNATRGWQTVGGGTCMWTGGTGCETAGAKLKTGGSSGFNLDMIGARLISYQGKNGETFFDGAGEYTSMWTKTPRGMCGMPTLYNYMITRIFFDTSVGVTRYYQDAGNENISLALPARCVRDY